MPTDPLITKMGRSVVEWFLSASTLSSSKTWGVSPTSLVSSKVFVVFQSVTSNFTPAFKAERACTYPFLVWWLYQTDLDHYDTEEDPSQGWRFPRCFLYNLYILGRGARIPSRDELWQSLSSLLSSLISIIDAPFSSRRNISSLPFSSSSSSRHHFAALLPTSPKVSRLRRRWVLTRRLSPKDMLQWRRMPRALWRVASSPSIQSDQIKVLWLILRNDSLSRLDDTGISVTKPWRVALCQGRAHEFLTTIAERW